MDDRREHPRVEVTTTAVVLARHNDGVPMTIDSISVGGARLVGALTVDRGDRVQILFEVDGSPVEVHGEVVRVEMRGVSTDCVSVRFVELDDDVRRRIRELVQRALDSEQDSVDEDGA